MRPIKKYIFNINDHVGIRYIYYLRLGLSPLRGYKKRHGFLDTPSPDCLCNVGNEDTSHFLFLCSIFDDQRAILIASVTGILQKYNLENLSQQSHLYLYGNKTISFIDNKQIILNTIKFIKETRRFTS